MQTFIAWQELIKNNAITTLQLFRVFCFLGKASWELFPLIGILQTLKNKIHARFIFHISIHQNIITDTKNLAKPAYETSIATCIPKIAIDRENQNIFWKPSGSLHAFLFRTNEGLGTIVLPRHLTTSQLLFIYLDFGSLSW